MFYAHQVLYFGRNDLSWNGTLTTDYGLLIFCNEAATMWCTCILSGGFSKTNTSLGHAWTAWLVIRLRVPSKYLSLRTVPEAYPCRGISLPVWLSKCFHRLKRYDSYRWKLNPLTGWKPIYYVWQKKSCQTRKANKGSNRILELLAAYTKRQTLTIWSYRHIYKWIHASLMALDKHIRFN